MSGDAISITIVLALIPTSFRNKQDLNPVFPSQLVSRDMPSMILKDDLDKERKREQLIAGTLAKLADSGEVSITILEKDSKESV